MLQKSFILSIMFILTIAFPFLVSGMPQITGIIETEFGPYIPYQVSIKPDAKPYSIAPDLSNVTNNKQFQLSQNDLALLAQNGFVSVPSNFKQVYDVYNYCKDRQIPIFVTTDSMLHTYHILFDYTLRILETREFIDDLQALNKTMLDKAIDQYNKATDPKARKATLKNLAYFTVASYLLDPSTKIPVDVKNLVESEFKLIQAHAGGSLSPIFGYEEDYSQYVPRGHYTRNEKLKKYFMSMMWYGRMSFRLNPREGEEKAKEETLQAILLVSAIKGAIVKNEPALNVWDRIYQPTVFFVGKADDLNIYEYMDLMIRFYGPNYDRLNPDELADSSKVEAFLAEARKLRNPMINSTFLWEGEDIGKTTKGFRFMGQRFIPDSYMFQQLVHDSVNGRLMPKGLDVMAVLGSERALHILDTIYDEDRLYPDYLKQISKLQKEFSSVETELWAQNLYWNWLYVLMTLLTEKGKGYPIFMQNPAWADKELVTALGSWAELRHDTILYAKQSYTMTTSIPLAPELVRGYVEPNPEFYARLASLSRFTREGLSRRGLLLKEFESRFIQLEELLVSLKKISELELTNQPLTSEQYGIIINMGSTLENITTFPSDISSEIEGEEDKEMAIVADVHTDPNTLSVLEVGVGYPLNLFVVIPVNNELRISQGPMFSYYEFPWPMADRLTDQSWQNMLKTAPPPLPIWMKTFIDLTAASLPVPHSNFKSEAKWMPVEVLVSIQPEVIELGNQIQVKVVVNGQVTANPEVTIVQGEKTVKQEMKKSSGNFFAQEYTSLLESKDFKPGTAVISVKGRVGEEEFQKTQQLILERASGVEDVTYTSELNKRPKLRNSLYQSFPNPFNPEVWIPYEIEKGSDVTVEIYNSLGQIVRVLELGYKGPGRYLDISKAVYWDGRNSHGEKISSGIYFYKFHAGDFIATGRMISVK